MKIGLSETGLDRAATSEEIRAAISFLPEYVEEEEEAIASEMILDCYGDLQHDLEQLGYLILIDKLNDTLT